MLRFLIFIATLATVAIAADPCTQKVDRGKDCNNNSTIKYYFDKEDLACYPFKFNGCAGNLNNFANRDDCFNKCHLDAGQADVQHCPGGPVVQQCNIQPQRPPLPGQTPPSPPPPCPKGSYCQNGFPVGVCCDEKLRDKAEAEEISNKADCPKGKKVVQFELWKGYNTDLRGKKCEHGFCPKGSSCIQKKTAFCCQ